MNLIDKLLNEYKSERADRAVDLYILWCSAFAEEAAVSISGAIGEERGIREEYYLPLYLDEAAEIVGD